MRTVETPKELILALGGPAKVRDMLRLETTSAVSNWNKRGIPQRWYYVLSKELDERGIDYAPALFGVPAAETGETA